MRSSAMRGFRAERYQASARARSRGAGKAGQDQRPRRVAKQASPARARALMLLVRGTIDVRDSRSPCIA
jgi:hypothetical protein